MNLSSRPVSVIRKQELAISLMPRTVCGKCVSTACALLLSPYQVCIETYTCSCHQRSINTAVRATLSQMLGDLTLQLRQRQENTVSLSLRMSETTLVMTLMSLHAICPRLAAPPTMGTSH